jgi:hypothetical protein
LRSCAWRTAQHSLQGKGEGGSTFIFHSGRKLNVTSHVVSGVSLAEGTASREMSSGCRLRNERHRMAARRPCTASSGVRLAHRWVLRLWQVDTSDSGEHTTSIFRACVNFDVPKMESARSSKICRTTSRFLRADWQVSLTFWTHSVFG